MKAYQWVLNLVDKASGPMQTILQKAEKMEAVFAKAKMGAKAFGVGLALANQAAQGLSTAANTLESAIAPGVRFEQSLADLSALTGQTGKDLALLGVAGRSMAGTFGGEVSSYIDSFKGLLGELGPQIATNKAAMNSMGTAVAVLSKSMGGDATGAMKALTTSLQQFNVNLKDPAGAAKAMTYAMNIMAAGANLGAAEVPQIADAIRVAGVAASNAKISFLDTNAAIQVLAQGGLKGAEAGTALRNVLGKLGEGRFLPKDVKTELTAAGVNIATLGNKSLGLVQRLSELQKIQGDSALVSKLFGVENANAANILLKGTGALTEYATKMAGTNAATDAARTIMDTHAGRMDRMRAMWENLGISVFEATKPYLPFIQNSAKIAVMTAQMTPLLQLMGAGFLKVVPSVWRFVAAQSASGLSVVKNGLLMAGSGVLGMVSATVAQWALNTAMSANPIGLILLGLAAVGLAVYGIIKHWDTLKGWIVGLGKFMWDMNPFVLMVRGIFQLFPSVEKWFDGLWSRITGFMKGLVGHIKGIWDTVAPYLGLGKLDLNLGGMDKLLKFDDPKFDPFAQGKDPLSMGKNPGLKEKVDKATSGGSKPTTVNITIGKFQDSINITTNNMQEGVNDVVKMLEEALERVVNGVSQGVGIAQ